MCGREKKNVTWSFVQKNQQTHRSISIFERPVLFLRTPTRPETFFQRHRHAFNFFATTRSSKYRPRRVRREKRCCTENVDIFFFDFFSRRSNELAKTDGRNNASISRPLCTTIMVRLTDSHKNVLVGQRHTVGRFL